MAAIGAAVVVALAAIIHGIVILTGGKELIAKAAANEVGLSESDLAGIDLSEIELPGGSTGQDVFNNRAYAVLACGILLLVFALLMRKAAMWARILVTLTALGAAGMSLIIVRDITTGLMAALGWVTIIGAVIAIVLAWLPAHSRYAKAAG